MHQSSKALERPQRPTVALGIDFSTHAIDIAKVGRDRIQEMRHIRIEGLDYNAQAEAIRAALAELHEPGMPAVLERPFLAAWTNRNGVRQVNAETLYRLTREMARLEYLAHAAGYRVLVMTASEWRSLVGIEHHRNGRQVKRERLKLDAVGQVRQIFGVSLTHDMAEAVLMATAGLQIVRREAMVAR